MGFLASLINLSTCSPTETSFSPLLSGLEVTWSPFSFSDTPDSDSFAILAISVAGSRWEMKECYSWVKTEAKRNFYSRLEELSIPQVDHVKRFPKRTLNYPCFPVRFSKWFRLNDDKLLKTKTKRESQRFGSSFFPSSLTKGKLTFYPSYTHSIDNVGSQSKWYFFSNVERTSLKKKSGIFSLSLKKKCPELINLPYRISNWSQRVQLHQ